MIVKKRQAICILGFLLFTSAGCKKSTTGANTLLGRWSLSSVEQCNQSVSSDHLTLEPNGRFRQDIVLSNGRERNMEGKWTFTAPSTLHLNKWGNSFEYEPRTDTDVPRVDKSFSVDFRPPMVLFADSNKKCVYTQPK